MEVFLEVFDALEKADVRYLVIGGLAVALHGVPRMTADIDLCLSLDRENVERTIQALTELGFKPRSPVDAMLFADEAIRLDWISNRNLTVFTLVKSHPFHLEMDLLAENPFDFEQAYAERMTKRIGNTSIAVLDRLRLIEMKRATGRSTDREDADFLEQENEGG